MCRNTLITFVVLLHMILTGCKPDPLCPSDDPGYIRPDNWSVASHCPGVDPDYGSLFRDDVVHRFHIIVSPEDYQATMDDLTEKLSGGTSGDAMAVSEDPIYVPVTVEFNGQKWHQVGMRYKGNSSLKAAWLLGKRKLAIRLNFDHYEERDLRLKNQRFFGFKKMTFSNAYNDPSLIRDKITGDLFRAAGVPAAQGAFARVYVDYGEGPVYFGLYTMIEDPSDAMLEDQFGTKEGVLYKPEGEGAMLATFMEEHMFRSTDEGGSDNSGVQRFIESLNADQSDRGLWRANLEAVFNVEGFIRYLAVNQALVNWDSYGFMPHNYYLYDMNGPDDRIHWIPWDFNLAMMDEASEEMNPGSVFLEEIGEEWPLIRFILDDPVYLQKYKEELAFFLEGAFSLATVTAKMEAYHALIAPYVTGEEGESWPKYSFIRTGEEFETSLTSGENALIPHIQERHEVVKAALGL